MTAHWGVEDPGHATGTEEDKAKAFWDAFMKLHRRISILLSLPMDKLDRLSLHKELQKIGQE
jgi:arsenate reductase